MKNTKNIKSKKKHQKHEEKYEKYQKLEKYEKKWKYESKDGEAGETPATLAAPAPNSVQYLPMTALPLLLCRMKDIWFVTFLSLCRSNILSWSHVQFSWLKECYVTQEANTVIAAHVEMLINNFNDRFHVLITTEFLSWLTQPLLVDLSAVSEQCQQE